MKDRQTKRQYLHTKYASYFLNHSPDQFFLGTISLLTDGEYEVDLDLSDDLFDELPQPEEIDLIVLGTPQKTNKR